ncbi:uncharacterized protein LOC120072617 isoform X3 [Benincasa hispida]|uniref:uncharacterized protein LOC120072617 isoform X3 n=1 Tax=Benincasa hispida TaxID=102211 RepID=UPI0019015030|nr:uncharacterized protein LOC120072617 isoform X3 [Benincasa hispida]
MTFGHGEMNTLFQELYRSKLLSSYKEMVDVVVQMVNASRLMKCYFKRSSSSSLIQFSTSSEDNHNEDAGDGGGVSVFTLLTIPCFEKLAEELVHMFGLELNLKRLLLMELLSLSSESSTKSLVWSEELYSGEFNNLRLCNLWSKETSELLHPTLKGHECSTPIVSRTQHPNAEVLQVYLVTWLADVNIHTKRVDEIFELVSEEIHVSLS